MYDIEFTKYKKFVIEYFPHSPLVKNAMLKNIYVSVKHNIDFIKLISEIEGNEDTERKNLYKVFNHLNLRALYHFPSNDYFVYSLFVRAIVENLLRISINLFKCKFDGEIDQLNFTDMKNILKSQGFNHRYKDLYDNLTNYYGRYSKDIHLKNAQSIVEHEFLVKIRKNLNEQKLNEFKNVYNRLGKLLVPFILKEIPTTKNDLPSAYLSRLLNTVGQHNYDLFLKK